MWENRFVRAAALAIGAANKQPVNLVEKIEAPRRELKEKTQKAKKRKDSPPGPDPDPPKKGGGGGPEGGGSKGSSTVKAAEESAEAGGKAGSSIAKAESTLAKVGNSLGKAGEAGEAGSLVIKGSRALRVLQVGGFVAEMAEPLFLFLNFLASIEQGREELRSSWFLQGFAHGLVARAADHNLEWIQANLGDHTLALEKKYEVPHRVGQSYGLMTEGWRQGLTQGYKFAESLTVDDRAAWLLLAFSMMYPGNAIPENVHINKVDFTRGVVHSLGGCTILCVNEGRTFVE